MWSKWIDDENAEKISTKSMIIVKDIVPYQGDFEALGAQLRIFAEKVYGYVQQHPLKMTQSHWIAPDHETLQIDRRLRTSPDLVLPLSCLIVMLSCPNCTIIAEKSEYTQ